MQLIPETAQRFQVADPFDPESNVRGGLAYLRELLGMFDGDVQLVAAAYNAGEGALWPAIQPAAGAEGDPRRTG
jgi:soluble lytic murein transglycosylase-like protein